MEQGSVKMRVGMEGDTLVYSVFFVQMFGNHQFGKDTPMKFNSEFTPEILTIFQETKCLPLLEANFFMGKAIYLTLLGMDIYSRLLW